MSDWIWAGITAVLVIMIVWLWRHLRRVLRMQRLPDPPLSTIIDPPKPTQAKCHIITYRYADGWIEVVHSICGSDGKRHDDAYGQALHPESPLVHTTGGVHTVEIY